MSTVVVRVHVGEFLDGVVLREADDAVRMRVMLRRDPQADRGALAAMCPEAGSVRVTQSFVTVGAVFGLHGLVHPRIQPFECLARHVLRIAGHVGHL